MLLAWHRTRPSPRPPKLPFIPPPLLRRCVYVLDASGAVHTKIGPLPEQLLQLAWANGSTLIGGTPGAIHTWTQVQCGWPPPAEPTGSVCEEPTQGQGS